MSDSISISRPYTKSEAKPLGRWHHYLLTGLLINAVIWGAALLYLKKKTPEFTSALTVSVPGISADANVSVPGIGQASYNNPNPYSIGTQDPRQNYKYIAQSEPVLETAAAQLNMSLKEFGAPRIRLADSTTIMLIEMEGLSPEEARNKSLSLFKAMQIRLGELRAQEIVQRDAGFQSSLGASQNKLEIAQKRLSEYKSRSGLNSSDQLKALSDNIEQLRRQRAEIISQQREASGRVAQLAANLKLSNQEAADAFVLQTDQIFQDNLKNYSETTSSLTTLSTKFLPNHPTIVAEKAKQEAARKALEERSQALLGRPVSEASLQGLNINSANGAGREELFQDLVTYQSQQRGLSEQSQAITQQIALLENRLQNLAQQESTLEALRRDLQVAEAVFSSTLARLDLGRSNAFGSYPLVQMLAQPTLPKSPSSPKTNFVFLGAGFSSIFLTTALGTLWLHSRRRARQTEEQLIPVRSELPMRSELPNSEK